MHTLIVVTAYPRSFAAVSEKLAAPWSVQVWKVFTFGTNQFRNRLLLVAEIAVNLIRMSVTPGMYRNGQPFICTESHMGIAVLLFKKWQRLWGIRNRVYLIHFFIHSWSGLYATRIILGSLLDSDVGIMAYSKSDADYIRKSGRNPDVGCTPWCGGDAGFAVEETAIRNDGYFFSGGYANRNYDLLIRCARRLPAQRFIIVCSARNVIKETPPSNVTILRDIPSADFHRLMAGSRAVIIPLNAPHGSSGQMSAVAAMKIGKTAIVPDFDIIAQYFTHKKDGIIYDPASEESLFAAVRSVAENPAYRAALGREALKTWGERFTQEQFERKIMDHAAAFLGFTWRT